MKKFTSLLPVFFFFLMFSVFGQEMSDVQKIFPTDNTDADRFGWSVSMSGDFLVVGAPYDNETGNWSGAAYIYKRSGNEWVQDTKITDNNGGQFGFSVAIDGEYLVVGSINTKNDQGIFTGAAFVYHYNGSVWEHEATLFAGTNENEEQVGTFVTVSGTTIAVSAVNNSDLHHPVFIFEKTKGGWTQVKKIVNTCMEVYSISLYDTMLAIGYRHDNSVNSGAVHLVYRNNGNWDTTQVIVPEEGNENGAFGKSVSLYKNNLMVGAYGDYKSLNSAYIFTRENGQWMEKAVLLPEDTIGYDVGWFNAVAINDRYALIGAVDANYNGHHTGAAYLYEYENNEWHYKSMLTPTVNPNVIDGDSHFGRSVALYDTCFLVGASNMSNDTWFTTGAAFIYNCNYLPVGINEPLKKGDFTFSLYPNPVADHLNLYFQSISTREISLFDMSGKQKFHVTSSQKNISVNTSALASGSYLLKVKEGKKQVVKMVVKTVAED
jgi:hypothetical protein